MRYILSILCIMFFGPRLIGQTVPENSIGKVSFVSSQNIYVKFTSTTGISAGDTLFILSKGELRPVLIVNNLSSVSCVCTPLSAVSLSVESQVIARKRISETKPEEKIIEDIVNKPTEETEPVDSAKIRSVQSGLKQKVTGSLSAYSYSDFSTNSAANSNRFRYTLSLNIQNIASSKLSIESYVSFRHKLGEWNEVQSDLFNALKIYNLSVRYSPNKNTHIILGRKINPKISSIGAMDGLQFETSIKRFTLGAIAGSRPDYTNYNVDTKLFQYGAYLAFNTVKASSYSASSIAFMEQTNDGKTDRRFLYFQHSNSLIKNVYFFSSFEVDLYKLINDSLNIDLPQSTFSPTGLYLSLRYRITKDLSITGSYDARKNVIYYETYKSYIDRVLESEMRQSFRLSANYRITRDLMLGVQSGYRFLKTDPHPSENIYSYLTYSQIPGLNMSLTLSATLLKSNYLNGKIFGANMSRDLFKGKFQTYLGYRYVDYNFPENPLNTVQHIGEMNLSMQFLKKMSLSLNYEGTFEQKERYDRLYMQIRLRF